LATSISFTDNGLESGILNVIDAVLTTFGSRVNFSGNMRPPQYTIASKPTTGNYLGDIISISNSPTYTGRLAYWANGTTSRYVSDEYAV
jgi:hypothetical protein